MKERINRLAKGIIDSELPKMIYSPERIEETIRINSVAIRDLLIVSENGLNVKGLVYSSNARVKIPSERNAFGGIRNHIAYEVDTSFLVTGDEIKGTFSLVTNCGEKEIPYTFYVDLASSGRILGELKTAEDFLYLAEQDMDTALRLLEYQDFLEAPFMQDMRVRSIYDGLRGHGNRQNFMEEFLIALEVKKPIHLNMDETKKIYKNLQNGLEDFITIEADHWGYVYMEAAADGDFIHLPKKSATQADFDQGTFRLPIRILPENLHAGKNFGRIFITTSKEQKQMIIEVHNERAPKSGKERFDAKDWMELLRLRLEYESTLNAREPLLKQMQKKLDQIRMRCRDSVLCLLQTEMDLLSGEKNRAGRALDEVRTEVLNEYAGNRVVICYFQYLQVQIFNEPEQKNALIRLLQKYCSEDGSSRSNQDILLYLMLLRMNPELFENPGTVFISMNQEFKDGCTSPFLYNECLKLLNTHPELLRSLGQFETQVLLFGVKREIVSRSLALRVSEVARQQKTFKKVNLTLLTGLYEMYQDSDLLVSICTMLIKENCRSKNYFIWYDRGVCAGINLTRLYEYYLYTLPDNYSQLLPKEIFLYFSYATEMNQYSRCVLYRNLLLYGDRESEIYHDYKRSIEQFAIEQLFAGRINNELAVIYQDILYEELIDRQLARTLPEILCSHRILCREPGMQYVVVRHAELMREDAYSLWEGEAYVPLFSERDVIQFQDSYGNRYINVNYEKTPVMRDVKHLLNLCFQMYQEHPVLLIEACYEIIEKDTLTSKEAAFLEQTAQKMELHPLFHKKIISAILRYYMNLADEHAEGETNTGISYLLSLNKDSLTREERNAICEILIKRNYDSEAYSMIFRYGAEGIDTECLLKLTEKMVLQKLFDEDDYLLRLAWLIFSHEKGDSIILDYLCEHFNGIVEQMYRILIQAIKEHIETYDLEERLLAQMLFTGETEKMDQVFELYASRKKINESIVKAYFTVKSTSYFLDNKMTQDRVFTYLESVVNTSSDKDKVPEIYLLALTKYYATLPELNKEQRNLCQVVVDVLLEAGMLFAYFRDLSRFIKIPGNILDKEMIEYHGNKERKPYLQLRILPEEEEFHFEEMRSIYRGIYIKEKVLFEGEILEYRIYEEEEGKQNKVAEGRILRKEMLNRSPGSRFAYLNEMGLSLDLKNENALKETMKEYLKKDEAVKTLFTLRPSSGRKEL